MPTTSNFGWTTPADTDLVKDGAAAIRTLGNGIDTSFLDLKGGTTGQVLSKASNTDLDFTWTAGGDITEVQAGTGISVASGTGPIPVVTNTVATAFDAAGDLVYGTGADTFTKLSLGTAGQVLKVNSGATAPEWGSAATTYAGVSVRKSSNQSIPDGSDTAITWDTENFDTDAFHNNSTNTSRLTIPAGKAGKYLLSGAISWGASNSGTYRAIKIYKNGSSLNQVVQFAGTNDGTIQPISNVYDLAVSDYIELYARQNSGGNLDIQSGTQQSTVQLSYLGA